MAHMLELSRSVLKWGIKVLFYHPLEATYTQGPKAMGHSQGSKALVKIAKQVKLLKRRV